MKLLARLVLFRLLNSLALNTFYVPDEYFQSLEPAHRAVFGFSFDTWEWRSSNLRSPILALFISLPWWPLKLFHLDFAWTLVFSVKILMAFVAASTDYYTYHFARIVFRSHFNVRQSQKMAKNALLVSISSLYSFYVYVRPLSNTVEALLLVVALYHSPYFNPSTSSPYKSLALFAVSTAIRPSSLIPMIPLILFLLRSHSLESLLVVTLGASACFALDSLYYGTLTFTPLNFVRFNLLSSGASFYGTHRLGWYFTEGVGVVMGAWTPALLHGCWRILRSNTLKQNSRIMMVLVMAFWTMLCLSLLPHKEHRFLTPIIPLLHILCVFSFPLDSLPLSSKRTSIPLLLHALLIPPLLFHMHSQNLVPIFLSHTSLLPLNSSLGVLAPCHSFPWSSHLHRSDLHSTSWFLTCDPPGFRISNDEFEDLSKDEADVFYSNPITFLHDRMYEPSKPSSPNSTSGWGKLKPWPSHLLIFEALISHQKYGDDVKELLDSKGYSQKKRWKNGLGGWHEDERRRGDIILLERV